MKKQIQFILNTNRFKNYYYVLIEITTTHVNFVINNKFEQINENYFDVYDQLFNLQKTFDFFRKKQSFLLEKHKINLSNLLNKNVNAKTTHHKIKFEKIRKSIIYLQC